MIYYKVMLKSFLKRFGLFGLMMFSFGAFAQEAELGMEYMKAGEYEKAKTVFQKLAKNKETAKVIHKPYLQTLIKLKEFLICFFTNFSASSNSFNLISVCK